MKEKCKDCKWWRENLENKDEKHREGNCQRYAPKCTDGNADLAIWPWTNGKDWCGEFQGKEEIGL